MAIHVSNICNVVLFTTKVYTSIASRSLAVIALTMYSLLDILPGSILGFTAYEAQTRWLIAASPRPTRREHGHTPEARTTPRRTQDVGPDAA